MKKVKVNYLIPKGLSIAIDRLIALVTLKGGKLKKTDLATDALMREYLKRQLELEKDKLKLLNGVDLECLADKIIKIKNFTSDLSDDFKYVTAYIAEKGFRCLDKNIKENGEEADEELQYIASSLNIAGWDKAWDKEAVKYFVLLAIEDCRKIQECKEKAKSLEKTLQEIPLIRKKIG